MQKLQEKEIDKIIELYNLGYGSNKIGKIMNIHFSTILKYLKRYNIKIRKKQKIKEDTNVVKEIINDYVVNRISINKLKLKYNARSGTIKSVLMNNNIKIRDGEEARREYKANYNYFDNIDSADKAYWLGFIYADGYNNGHRIQIGLSRKDESHLELFKKYLKSEHPIQRYEQGPSFSYQDKNKIFYISRIIINSKHIGETLLKLGVNNKKTIHSSFPNIIPKFHNHFIRGYFDGDGCISYTVGKTGTVSFSSNENIIRDLARNISENIGVKFKLFAIKNSEICWVMQIYSKQNIIKFMNWIYKDHNNILLNRKYDKYQSYLRDYCNLTS